MTTYNNVVEYISQFPKEVQQILEAVRITIQEAAPQATEKISYGIPTFYQSENLVHFAGYKNHIGFYPGAEAIKVFSKDFEGLKTSKGAVQFPFSEPLPLELIKQIVAYRLERLKEKATGK